MLKVSVFETFFSPEEKLAIMDETSNFFLIVRSKLFWISCFSIFRNYPRLLLRLPSFISCLCYLLYPFYSWFTFIPFCYFSCFMYLFYLYSSITRFYHQFSSLMVNSLFSSTRCSVLLFLLNLFQYCQIWTFINSNETTNSIHYTYTLLKQIFRLPENLGKNNIRN